MPLKKDFYKNIQNKLKVDKCVAKYEVEDLDYLRKPIGKANFKEPVEVVKPTKKPTWNDRVKCDVCNKEYNRSAGTSHRGTKLHQAYLNKNKKLVGLITKDTEK